MKHKPIKKRNLSIMKGILLLGIFLSIFSFSGNEQVNLPFMLVEEEKGTASYYAKKFNGRRTTSGEKFNNDSLTCAHKKHKFGTMLIVTNLSNDSVVRVRVNDRLPQKSRRIIDLSYVAAKQLNFISKGLTKVSIVEEIQ